MLLERGFNVTVLDNFRYGQTSLLDCCVHRGFRIRQGDCRDEAVLREELREVDCVLPLAALVGASLCDADTVGARTINIDAMRLLLSLRSAAQRVVFPCTNSWYGIGEKDKFCTEETPLRPISLYGKTKVEAESAVLEAGNAISVRLATVFGVPPACGSICWSTTSSAAR